MGNNEQKPTVAYAPFKTFLSAIETLEQGVPQRIDSSIWPSYSGAIRSQLLGAFRFLGLVDESSKPTQRLKQLVEDKTNRKDALCKTLVDGYPELVSMNLTTATPRQFEEAMRSYGVQGDTLVKATSFFLQAAKYSELPISALLLERKPRGTAIRRQKRAQSVAGQDQLELDDEATTAVEGTSKTINLESGLTLTVTVSGNFLELTSRDREFVFSLTDKLDEYAKQK
jgi:hypothetical protein